MADRNFLGIPIEGDFNAGSTRVEQLPREAFEPLVRAVLDDPTIVAFGWRQYTPYFNDGDVCVFGAHGLWVRTVDDDAEEDAEEEDAERLTVEYGHPTLGEMEWSWDYGTEWPNRQRVEVAYNGPDRDRLRRCLALSDAIDGGHFDNVLLELFGDHCDITVHRNGIQVDGYSHD